jgi:hypothetical protein
MIDLKSMGLDPKSRKARMRRIALVVMSAWKAEAQSHGLKSTLALYKRAIQIRSISSEHCIITLKGIVPNLIEQGTPPHDMRDYLLKTRRAGASPIRKNKEGKPYRFIMFGRKTSMIKQYGGGKGYSEAKGLEPTTASASGKLLYGSRFASASKHFVNKSGIRSVSGALDGMVRLVSTHSASAGGTARTSSIYKTWRAVSYKRPEAWQHPGLDAANIAGKVRAQLPSLIEGAGL